jgi:hypothetical protein
MCQELWIWCLIFFYSILKGIVLHSTRKNKDNLESLSNLIKFSQLINDTIEIRPQSYNIHSSYFLPGTYYFKILTFLLLVATGNPENTYIVLKNNMVYILGVHIQTHTYRHKHIKRSDIVTIEMCQTCFRKCLLKRIFHFTFGYFYFDWQSYLSILELFLNSHHSTANNEELPFK